ncbi:MAG: outer membrane protein assembly factor BamE [Candidatus Omnitrophica bacterium]|nr:outer membrane protein assembly factor BamE [Candidatus Omnitrophota bacterium]MDD5238183.1 outer membrane protein assembly factor BamE [Candidatus Omnitrophota bacterium]
MQGKIRLRALGFLLVVCALGLFLLRFKKDLISLIPAKSNKHDISKLKSGMSKQEVLGIMGTPAKTEVRLLGNRVIEFLFYKTKSNIFSAKDTDLLPVAIDQSGIVISIDKKFYEQLAK